MNNSIFGNEQPLFDPSNIQQSYIDTCAIKSQQLILETFGIDVSEDQLVNEALTLQIYQPGHGTPLNHMGDLLELHGVDCTLFNAANKYTLMHELAQGHQVMVAVDSGELWTPGFEEQIKDFLFGDTPNHALIVTGVDTSNPDALEVILSDPGTGKVLRYPYEQFAEAWSDSSFTMLATNDSPVAIENGILDTIMGMNTPQWLESCGDMLETGIEVAQSIYEYLQDHPEIVMAATEILPLFLANNSEAAAEFGINLENSYVEFTC